MAVSQEAFITRYPRLYHVTKAGSWCNIRQDGLLSTSSLLALSNLCPEERKRIEREQRLESVEVTYLPGKRARIRDQKPISERASLRCFVGISPPEWYRLLNGRVFFWVSEDRVNRILDAYKNEKHDILTIDAAAFVQKYAAKIELSPINSGAAGPAYAKRGADLFKTLVEFPSETWKEKRNRAVAELTIREKVEDIRDFVIRVNSPN